ncbi:MAG TPA: tRNA epoxyqueuosine(34) reductase QueG [Thiolinea sp.]|nr:tRNA epoxyqueuosine(34) reductase QueG [Thiolinea sp.]
MAGLESEAAENITIITKIRAWGKQLGFDEVGFAGLDLSVAEQHLLDWLEQGFQGDMDWMQRHGLKRSRPAELVPGTVSVISVRMNYLPAEAADAGMVLNRPDLAYVSRYALGRDYHKLMRQRLEKLAQLIRTAVGALGYRVFVDSAPVLEKPLAVRAGLGWMGKHTNILSREAGSWFFLGEIYTDRALPETGVTDAHCGSCSACIDICPTAAIIAPYVLDARRCISYLTIEHQGSIPLPLRPLLGNRIYGCDDCQLVCPWNRFARVTESGDFAVRHGLDAPDVLALLQWSEQLFLERMQGSPIRRIGYQRWQRNLAVAAGNMPPSLVVLSALEQVLAGTADELVREHLAWAIGRHVDGLDRF